VLDVIDGIVLYNREVDAAISVAFGRVSALR